MLTASNSHPQLFNPLRELAALDVAEAKAAEAKAAPPSLTHHSTKSTGFITHLPFFSSSHSLVTPEPALASSSEFARPFVRLVCVCVCVCATCADAREQLLLSSCTLQCLPWELLLSDFCLRAFSCEQLLARQHMDRTPFATATAMPVYFSCFYGPAQADKSTAATADSQREWLTRTILHSLRASGRVRVAAPRVSLS